MRAKANAEALIRIAKAIESQSKGNEAVNLSVAEKYIHAFGELAKESNTVIVPSNVSDISGMVTQVMSVMKGIQKKQN